VRYFRAKKQTRVAELCVLGEKELTDGQSAKFTFAFDAAWWFSLL
jgi:hypothetical protein